MCAPDWNDAVDRADEQLAARIGGNRACLALARKLLKRSYHILKALDEQALGPVAG